MSDALCIPSPPADNQTSVWPAESVFGAHCAFRESKALPASQVEELATGRHKHRDQKWYQSAALCVLCPLPARAASVHLALLPLGAPLPADHLPEPGHLQNAPLPSHPPRSQPDLLPEDEEEGLGEQEGRAEAKGAETL